MVQYSICLWWSISHRYGALFCVQICYSLPIPHICHFFYTDRIFENQILHPKKRLKAPKTLKMSLKKSNICIFFTQSGKIYTWQKIFTQAPPVVPVTNMRYAPYLLILIFWILNLHIIMSQVKKIQRDTFFLEKFTPDRKFLHRHVCGVCDKYEVCHTGSQPTF